MINNQVHSKVVSGTQQSDSVIHIHVSFFPLCLGAGRILVPRPTEFGPLAVRAQSPNHWNTREAFLIKFKIYKMTSNIINN